MSGELTPGQRTKCMLLDIELEFERSDRICVWRSQRGDHCGDLLVKKLAKGLGGVAYFKNAEQAITAAAAPKAHKMEWD